MERSGDGAHGVVGGEWVVPDVSYVDPVRQHCAFCGRPIARRYWKGEVGGVERAYCGPEHAARDATYPKRLAKDGDEGVGC